MSRGFTFDQALAQRIEAVYKTRDAARRRRVVLDALDLRPGERVIDIGTGPGFLAREMASLVGPAGEVLGVDTSEAMLELARNRCAEIGWVQLRQGDASDLPVPDASFDVAVSIQVFEYVADVSKPIAQMHRSLRPGGRAVIVSTDWHSFIWHARDTVRANKVLSAFIEHCAIPDLPRTLGPRLKLVGFTVEDAQVIVQFNPTLAANSFSYHLIPIAKAFVSGRHGVTEAEAQAWADELYDLGERGEYFFCLNQFLFAVTKPL
ncbi:MAG TPA: methyltransferase domain-containing protein [Burkholderiaceae bacterium]|nr:methyltransferase domain-containing protein [Burkholderiaceae bacterium]